MCSREGANVLSLFTLYEKRNVYIAKLGQDSIDLVLQFDSSKRRSICSNGFWF